MLEKEVLDDIVCRMDKFQWSMTEAQKWYDYLKLRNVQLPVLGMFYQEVRNHFDVFHEEMVKNISRQEVAVASETTRGKLMQNPYIIAQSNVVCKSTQHTVIHLGSEQLPDHELESLNMFYCLECNAFWREP